MAVQLGSPLILQGKGSPVGQQVNALADDEYGLFQAEWGKMMSSIADADMVAGYQANFSAYAWAASQAKSVLQEAFGGLRPVSGQFGWRLFTPQDIGTSFNFAATPPTSNVHTWRQSIVLAASHTSATLFNITGMSTTIGQRNFHSFHGFVSWRPGSRIVAMTLTINLIPYTVWGADVFSKTPKTLKPFRMFPLGVDNGKDGAIVWPGNTSTWSLVITEDPEDIAFSAGQTIIEEIAPMGLVFGEYTYLATQLN